MGIIDAVLNKSIEKIPKKKYSDGEMYLLKALLNLLLYVGTSKSPKGVDGKLFFIDSESGDHISDVGRMT